MDRQTRAQFAEKLASRLPKGSVLLQPEQLAPYECDGLSVYRKTPLLVVLPETIDDVQWIMQQCKEHSVPVVTRGAGTGLSGGALPDENAVLLVMSRFSRILDIDIDNRVARVQPGVRNLALSEAVRHLGLYYAPDPSSQIACSIGGNVAENSGGVHCLKYGLTVHNVREITLVTIDGEVLKVGSLAWDSPGYDLLALLTGSEGMLGVIVEVTVNLLPIPETSQALLASFNSVEAASDAVASIISEGIIPAGLEMMDNPAIRAAEDFVHADYPVEAAAILICELDGVEADVEQEMRQVDTILRRSGATQLRIAKSAEERALFWAGRKAAFPAVGRISPDYYCMDGTIPRKHLAKVLSIIGELSETYGLRIANVFHAGDGNLHPLILFDANVPGELETAETIGQKILEASVEYGGTVTGEHGVGIEKLAPMCVQFNAEELTQFHALKAAFDPGTLLNPGKAVPTLHRCAEFGAMHVHHGQLPHPDLPRF
ncbi:MAG: FAD-binding protein [Gammaproteobacteria bacterium]|nr:FAD-binding protein [Gammaproteobacteria bacterium]